MENIPVRNAFGPEVLWSLRYWFRKHRARNWRPATATIQGYELLLAANNGWLVVFYSYELEGEYYSGEFRLWRLLSSAHWQAQVTKYTDRFPVGSEIQVLVDRDDPNISVAL